MVASVSREQGAIGEAVAVANVGYVGIGEHREYTWDSPGGFDIELGDTTAAHAGKEELGDELTREG